MKKEIYKPYQIILLCIFSIVINYCGSSLANFYRLPLWLDSFGTFLTAYALGPVCGSIVGIAGNLIYGFVNPVTAIYSITSVCMALVFGEMAKHGWMQKFTKAITLSVLVGFVSTITSVVLNVIFYGGSVGNIWGDGLVALLEKWNIPYPVRIVLGQFYLEFFDKLITILALYGFIRLYRMIIANIQSKKTVEPPKKLGIICLLLLSGLSGFKNQELWAQNQEFNSYVRTIYNNTNGLPSGEANDIVSTNDGVIWVGTYAGLYRHNGREFRLINEYPSIKAIKCLYVDNEGRLFIGTNDNGLSIMINEEISNVLEEKDGLPSDTIRCITRAHNSYYYVGTSAGMAVLSIADGLHVVKTFPQIESAVRVTADSKNHIAAVTSAGALHIIYGIDIIQAEIEQQEKFTSIAFSSDGLLYAASESNKIMVYEILDSPAVDSNTKPQKCYLKLVDLLECGGLEHIQSIDFQRDAVFLCADNGAGYFKDNKWYELETGVFNNSIDNMTADYQGNLWFSSSRLGLLKMCESAFVDIYHSAGLQEAVVNTINQFNGELYFGTDNGLAVIDAQTKSAGSNALTEYLKNIRVRCLFVDKEGNMWICTKGKGLISCNPQGKIRQFDQGHMRVAIQLADGTIAAGGNDGVIFIKDNVISGRLTSSSGFENPTVLSLSQSPDGTIFAGTDGGGIAVIRNKKIMGLLKKSDGLSSNIILRTINDLDAGKPTGNTFVVTSNGLCYLEKNEEENKASSDYTIKILDNFPYANNYDLVINEDNNVFVLGSAGIFVVNRQQLVSGAKPDYELLDLRKGLLSSLTANSWNYVDENANLYISCDTGASYLNLYTYNKTERTYRIQLKSIIIDGKRHIIQKDIPFVIPADANVIEIEPEIINYSINNPYIRIFFEGVDEKPSLMFQSDITTMLYNNLSSGSHIYSIEVLDSRGISILEKTNYVIKKAYNIYDNWWFILYTVIEVIIFIVWITWFMTSTIQNRHIRRQEKELENIKNQVRMGNETIFAIANAVEARDMRTGRHSYRVAEYAVMIARELGFSDEQLENIRKIGLLHDIGKIGVPDNILNKTSALTDAEYRIMRSHVLIGSEILKDFSIIENVAVGARYHHERYDGSGYVEGLKGEEIPLTARIIGLADAFDAMTADRIYRKALSMDTVISEIKRGSGTQFDPGLVDILLELLNNGTLNVMEVMENSMAVDTNAISENEKNA